MELTTKNTFTEELNLWQIRQHIRIKLLNLHAPKRDLEVEGRITAIDWQDSSFIILKLPIGYLVSIEWVFELNRNEGGVNEQ